MAHVSLKKGLGNEVSSCGKDGKFFLHDLHNLRKHYPKYFPTNTEFLSSALGLKRMVDNMLYYRGF